MLDKSERSHVKPMSQAEELAKFDALAEEWWDPNGKFRHVLAFNEARVQAITRELINHFARSSKQDPYPLSGLRVLDIGCGGGLVSEALARAGARVTGIDGSEYSIKVARAHAEQSQVDVSYRHLLAEDILAEGPEPYDVVLNTEVIEHVEDQQGLMDVCAQLTKPEGMLVLATLNRTPKSWLFGIVGAEYVLRLLPKGTHDWRYFVRPEEAAHMLEPHGLSVTKVTGFSFNPFTRNWRESQDTKVNYMAFAMRQRQGL